jgi:hypothetical protein
MQTHPSPHPSLLRGERVNPSQRGEQSRYLGFRLRAARCSLSLRERVRVRGNCSAYDHAYWTILESVKLGRSSLDHHECSFS